MFDTSRKSAGVQAEMNDWRSKDARQSTIVQDMSDKFFVKRETSAGEVQDIDTAKPISAFGVSSRPAGFKSDAKNVKDMLELKPSVDIK